MFGVNAAPEIFQHALSTVLQDIPGVTHFIDDIIVHGANKATQQGRVICYASRALTDTEARYSQTEKEMLAVVYGVEKFHIYLYGSTFTVTTDHKPVLGIIRSTKPCSARIDRWRLRLMPYEFNLTYRPGKDEANPADYLSRHPCTQLSKDNEGEHYIRYVAGASIPNALSLDEVREATCNDKLLQKVISAVISGNWNNPSLSGFNSIKDELSIHDGIILRQTRIIIRGKLQKQVIKLAHASHQGIVKTKKLIREKFWFPGIDNMVKSHIKECIPCQASVSTPKQRDPLRMSPLPKCPWDELSVDFAGPFPTAEYLLIVIDDYSRYPEVAIINSTASKIVTPKLNEMFARFGSPSFLKSDNGAPFNRVEFEAFLRKLGFTHWKVTPLWPEANDEVERFVRSLNTFVHACESEESDWKAELSNFLRQYRATPHSSTKISPHEALTGRKIKVSLPEIITKEERKNDILENDNSPKETQKKNADKRRNAHQHQFKVGDTVLVRQTKKNKTCPAYNPHPYIVKNVKESMVTAENDRHTITRNSSLFKSVTLTVDSEVYNQPDPPESTMNDCPSDDHKPINQSDTTRLQIELPVPHSPAVDEVLPSPLETRLHAQTHSHPHTVTRSGCVVIPANRYTE